MRRHWMRDRRVLAVLMGAAAGVIVATQARLNGEFAGQAGSAVAGAALSAIGGFAVLSIGVLAYAPTRRVIASLPQQLRRGEVARWTMLSGALGALLLFSQASAVPLIGVALYSVLLVSAQTAGGLGVDAAGLGPAGRQPITGNRVAGALLAIIAVGVAAVPDFADGGFVVAAAVVSLAAGAAAAMQSAMLGRLGTATRSPGTAVWVNFTGAAGVLAVLLAAVTVTGEQWSLPPLGWPWLGGPLGVFVVGLVTVAVPIAGVLLVTLAIVAGQLLGSLTLDLLAPVDGRTPTAWSLAGALLLLAAVALAGRPAKRGAAAWKDSAP